MIDFTVASRMTATVSPKPVCCALALSLIYYEARTIENPHKVRPYLVADCLLVELVRIFREMVEQRHPHASIGAGEQLDQVYQNHCGVVIRGYIYSKLQNEGNDIRRRRATKFECGDEGRKDFIRSEHRRE